MKRIAVLALALLTASLVYSQIFLAAFHGSYTAPGGMPSGALGIWYADQYQTSPRNAVPNAASATSVSSNLVSAPRHLFNNGAYFSQNATTIVDNATTAPDGLTEASTVVWGNTDSYVKTVTMTLPAGTYTVGIDVKTTDSSTVSFRMGPNGSMVTKSANGSWQSFSTTFTIGSLQDPNVIFVRSANTTTPANLAICNARVFAGSSDLGADIMRGHMYFGSTNYDTAQPTYASGVLTLNAGGKFGTVQMPTSNSLTAWTAIVVGERLAAPSGQFQPFLSKIQSYTAFSALYAGSVGPEMQYGGANPILDDNNLWQYTNNEWHVITNVYSSPNATLWLDDVPLVTGSSSGLTASIQDLWVGVLNNTGIWSKYAFNAMALYNRALSSNEIRQAVSTLKSRASRSSITLNTHRILLAEGDSITWGTNTTNVIGYPGRFAVNSNPIANGVNRAVPGSTLANIISRASADDAVIPGNKNGRTFIYTLLIGRNDLVGYSGGATQYAADVASFLAARKAAGWDKVVLCTVLPSTVANFNTQRNLLNAIYTGAGWATAHNIDAICDFAADATMGPDSAASNATLYGDGTHPTDTGQNNLEVIYRAVINAL